MITLVTEWNEQPSKEDAYTKTFNLDFIAGRKNKEHFTYTVDRVAVTEKGVTCFLNHVFKYPKAGRKLDIFPYKGYHNKKLCVVDYLKEYLKCRNTKV